MFLSTAGPSIYPGGQIDARKWGNAAIDKHPVKGE